MRISTRNTEIEFNEELIAQVVYAIVKAVREDAPQYRRENHLETNNAARFIVGDYINENLRNHVVTDNIQLHHFKRYVWDGCLLIDHEGKITYTILSSTTLAGAAKRHGRKPYYLQTLLFAENGNCEGSPKQMTLADYFSSQGLVPFTDDEYESDFNDIMQGEIQLEDDYRHYVITYTAERSEIVDIRLVYLDRDFDEVDSKDLIEYITPDFAQLTATYAEEDEETEAVERPMVTLKLKQGVRPVIRAMEEEA